MSEEEPPRRASSHQPSMRRVPPAGGRREDLLGSTNGEVEYRDGIRGKQQEGTAASSASSSSLPLDGSRPTANVQYEPYEDMSYLAMSAGSSSSSIGGQGVLSCTASFASSLLASTGSSSSSHYSISSSSFPAKLHRILRDPEFSPDLISWLPHGRAWRVRNQAELESICFPLYFRHSRFASFLRQVNGWGFKRVLSGSDENAYYHECFLRGLPEISERMRRAPVPPSPNSPAGYQRGSRQSSSRGSGGSISLRSSGLGHPWAIVIPPDFYDISERHPLPDADGNWPEGQGPPQHRSGRGGRDPHEVPTSSTSLSATVRTLPLAVTSAAAREISTSMQQPPISASQQGQQQGLVPPGQLGALLPAQQAADLLRGQHLASQQQHQQQVLLPQVAHLVLPTTLTATAAVPALATVNIPVATAAMTEDPRVALILQQQNQPYSGPAPAAPMVLHNQLVQLQAAVVVGSPQMQQQNLRRNHGGEPPNARESAAHAELVRRRFNDVVAAEVYRRAHERNNAESNSSGGNNNVANAVLSDLICRVTSASVPSSVSQQQWQQGMTADVAIPVLATMAQPSIAATAAQRGVAAQMHPAATATIADNLFQVIPATPSILAAHPAANQGPLRQAPPQPLPQLEQLGQMGGLAPLLPTLGLGGGQHGSGSNAHVPQQQLLLSPLTAGGTSSSTRLQIQELLRRNGGRPTNEEGKQNEQQDRGSGSATVGTEEERSAR